MVHTARMRRLPAFACSLSLLAAVAGCKPRAASTTPLEAPPPALVATEAADIDALCGDGWEGRVRAWEVLGEAGEQLATTQGVCMPAPNADAPGKYLAISQLRSAEQTLYELRLWLTADGVPVAGQLRQPTSTRYYTWSEAGLTETHLGDVRTQASADAEATTWVVPSHALFVRELMVRTAVGRTATETAPVTLRQLSYAPDRERFSKLELTPLRADVGATDPAAASDGAATLALGDGHFVLEGAATLGQLELNRFVDGGGRTVYRSIDAPAQIDESLPEVPRPAYRLGADLELRPVPIPAAKEAPALGADLVLANDGATAPRPGVLFISGAGAHDRLGFVGGELDVGSHEIHDGLARAGFAVLRYDDRGVGASEIGGDPTPGFLAVVDDARRALTALASRPEVDPTRIFVVGHGEGALIAALLGQERRRLGKRKRHVAGVVLLAAPGRNVRELVYAEIARSLADRDEFTRNAAIEDAKKIHAAAMADQDLPANAEPLREWMQEIFTIEPAKEIAKLASKGVPVLALQGSKDFQISPVADFELVKLSLRSPRHSEHNRAEAIADLDHLFKPEPGESHAGHYRDLSRHVDPLVVQMVADWLGEVLRPEATSK